MKNLWQDNRKMVVEDNQLAAQQFKQTEYVYDLVSGNVHRVSYQRGKVDQFHHVYRYDADNRIIEAHTTETTPLSDPKYGVVAIQNEPQITPYWHKDVSYEYYRHGPLARTMLGTQNVQGLDYIYTLQGWLKGVNSTDLDKDRSYRGDGYNTRFAKDVFSYGLHYYLRDYKSISSNYDVFAAQNEDDWLVGTSSYSNLFNGNIASMVTTITEPQTRDVLVMGNRYKYDQLNRLIRSESSTDAYDASAYNWKTTGTTIYENVFTYDANGNILTQQRANEINDPIDNLVYNYQSNRNRLIQVEDVSVHQSIYPDDIDNSQYTYDEEGRLKTDSQEGIADIVWRVDGKVKAITRNGDPHKKNLIFDYDAMGQRIAKHVYDENFQLQKSTYYILDASGNVMATYDKEINYAESKTYFKLKERYIYGSSRVGVRNSELDVLPLPDKNFSMTTVHYSIGSRTYELSNHLGNVLSVISDKVIPVFPYSNVISEMRADIRVAQDYSPFGVTLEGRDFVVDEGYRYGFNGYEGDSEFKGNGNSYRTEFRQYDPRIGRWLSIDPLFQNFPWQSPYVAFDNNPIYYKDPKGGAAEGQDESNGDPVKKAAKLTNSKNPRKRRKAQTLRGTNRYKNALAKQQGAIGLPSKNSNFDRRGGEFPNQGVSGDRYVDQPERRVNSFNSLGFKAARMDADGNLEVIQIGELGPAGEEDGPVWRPDNTYGQIAGTPVLVSDGNIVDTDGNILIPKLKGVSTDDGLYNAGETTLEGRVVSNDAVIRTSVRMIYDPSGTLKETKDLPEQEITLAVESQN